MQLGMIIRIPAFINIIIIVNAHRPFKKARSSWIYSPPTPGRIRYLGEGLKDWVAQLLKALSSRRGLGEGKLKWRKSLFNPPHPNLLPLEKEQSYLCPPSSGCAPYSLSQREENTHLRFILISGVILSPQWRLQS
jgi:hypothetical protein